MKKLILIFLLPLSVSAQIPGRLDSLQARVSVRCNRPSYTATFTAAKVWTALNDAQTPVCQDFDAYEKMDTLIIYKVPEGGTLPSDFLRVAWVDRMIGDTLRLPMQPIEAVNRWTVTGGTIANARYDLSKIESPRYYFVHGDKLITYPKDAKETTRRDSLLVGYWAISDPLTSASDTTQIYAEYREALLCKATSLILSWIGSDVESAMWEARYQEEVKKYGRVKK